MADVELDLEITDTDELRSLGVHAYITRDFGNAAAAFGRATQLMAQKVGDEDDSLGEVYVHYARALLELSREEAEPLGDAFPHRPDGEAESSDDDDADDNANANANGTDQPLQLNGEEETEKTETVNADRNENSEKEAAGPSADSEECTDLQLAWEVLEVAKKIFTKRGESGKALLAETLILLGEVAMESENFTDGVNDMKAGLDMQVALYEPTNRKLAETYYKLGIANTTISNIDDAVANFEASIDTLKKRIQFLKEKITDQKSEENEKNKYEVEEMTELIPEIEEKINDTKSIKDETARLLLEMTTGKKEEEAEVDVESSVEKVKVGSVGSANDISHLVKRKRRPDESPDANSVEPAKKPTP